MRDISESHTRPQMLLRAPAPSRSALQVAALQYASILGPTCSAFITFSIHPKPWFGQFGGFLCMPATLTGVAIYRPLATHGHGQLQLQLVWLTTHLFVGV